MVDGFFCSSSETLRRSILVIGSTVHEYATVPLSYLVYDDFISNVVWGSLQVRFDVIGSTAYSSRSTDWLMPLFVIVLAVLYFFSAKNW